MWSSLSLLLCLHAVLLIQTTDSSVLDGLVSTPWGKIQGVPRTSSSGPNHTSFEGIPYAKPPLRNLRFSKPVPSTGSNATVLEADAVQPSCLTNNKTRESEDCLYLDLYVPHSNSNESSSLPVMVYIHGGFFIYYIGDVTAERLLAKNVIVALVHYRLGAMGFLSTGDDVLKGNYGLWDQRMAIQWVKDNVAAFGGNPNSITVFGESAGAASAGYQILAPKANDLFQRAILQSGSANARWALSKQPATYANMLGSSLECESVSSSADLATCLRGIDGVHLQKMAWALVHFSLSKGQLGSYMFVPVVDHEFILDEPRKLLKNHSHLQSVGAFEKDIIIGLLNNDSSFIFEAKSIPKAPDFGRYFSKAVVPSLIRQLFGITTPKAEEAVYNFYRGDARRESLTKYMVSHGIVDVMFLIPSFEFVDSLCKSNWGSGRHYFYYFDYCPSFSPETCMGHGFDKSFLFSIPSRPINFTSTDQHVSDIFTSLLTNFAKTGIPDGASLNVPTWPPYSQGSKSYLEISADPQVKQNLLPNRTQLWSATVPSLLSKPNSSTRLHHWVTRRWYVYFSAYCVIVLKVIKLA